MNQAKRYLIKDFGKIGVNPNHNVDSCELCRYLEICGNTKKGKEIFKSCGEQMDHNEYFTHVNCRQCGNKLNDGYCQDCKEYV